jgi:ketosteroid isomerase-like protein
MDYKAVQQRTEIKSAKPDKRAGRPLERHRVRKELEALYVKQAEAYKAKDIKAFMENKTPDFSLKLLSGQTLSREQMESGVKQRMDRIKSVNYLVIKIEELTVTGKEAVAITTQEFSRTVTDQEGSDHAVVTRGTKHRDMWVKTSEGWKMKSVEELIQGQQTVGGKPSNAGKE